MPLSTPETRGSASIGGSDDIGDVMWAVPTITIGYPANIPNVIFHHATAAMVMATPIAHKGTVAGAKAVAMTVRSEEHTSELQSLMRISYAVFCLKKKTETTQRNRTQQRT